MNPRQGRAIVRLVNASFEGLAEYDGAAVSIAGRVRSSTHVRGEIAVIYGREVNKTIPLARVVSIDWLEEAA